MELIKEKNITKTKNITIKEKKNQIKQIKQIIHQNEKQIPKKKKKLNATQENQTSNTCPIKNETKLKMKIF